jgi:hypothetical protein
MVEIVQYDRCIIISAFTLGDPAQSSCLDSSDPEEVEIEQGLFSAASGRIFMKSIATVLVVT